ncbi:choice-of-anchor A family protein [Dyadobacter tibetensis]|uniref:choice-of-anchor A family protein n=1 Tax=Dyadobacter tibetensis TaxID=1211851 RepID=UPI0018DB9A44|nr:choice-of-anchor A family protein [Dyadobacter tibetensis]
MSRKFTVSFESNLTFFKILMIIGYVGLYASESHAQGVNNILTIPAKYQTTGFAGSGNFNALIFGNLTSNSGDTEGRLVVGGDFSFLTPNAGYSVGIAGPALGSSSAPVNTDNFIVNGDFTNLGSNWQVQGNIILNRVSVGSTTPTTMGTMQTGLTNYIKFNEGDLLNEYKALSIKLQNFAPTGTALQEFPWEPITLTGSNTELNVFELTIPAGHNTGISVMVPEGSSILINVTNTDVVISDGNMTINGKGIPLYGAGEKILFNFPNTTQLSLTRFGLLGSVLAPQASLSGSGGSINGQAVIGGNVEQIGGFEFHNFNLTANFDNALPVRLKQFLLNLENTDVQLEWSTIEERGSSHFEVEHTLDGKNWETLAAVGAEGESQAEMRYSYWYARASVGMHYFRLKMIDQDGTFSFSRIRSIHVGGGVSLYPNPVSERLLVSQPSLYDRIEIINASGLVVYSQALISEEGVDCRNLAQGFYTISLFRNGILESRHKLLVQRP